MFAYENSGNKADLKNDEDLHRITNRFTAIELIVS